MAIKILTERALLIDKMLIIADLHIGFESELYHSGISIPSQIYKIEESINKLIKRTKVKELIILGDLKHQVPGTFFQEIQEIPLFLERLSKKVKVTIVKGNHDADLEKITNTDIMSSKGIQVGKNGFVHGHAWFFAKLLDCEYLIMGHIHPAIEFAHRTKQPCWVRCKLGKKSIEKKFKKKCNIKEIIIMPSFNPLIGGLALNSDRISYGAILDNADMKNAKIFLLDGTYIGKLKSIKS
ncbi:MAG: metallophosphoesterase [Nanoarchaeota archaeon]|nr:metallophosphoesterase [Nanoarchaeota archaeon]